MTSINETLAKGLASKVVREIARYEYCNIEIDHFPRRKRIREAIKFFNKDLVHLHLGDAKKETSKWEMIYGGWSATMSTMCSQNSNPESNYDKLGFDIDLDLPREIVGKRIFITLSKHSLERLILRRKPTIKNYKSAVMYLNGIIKKVLLHCLDFLESNSTRTKKKFVAKIDGLVFPIVFNIGITPERKLGFSFTVETVMPEDYVGAEKAMVETPNHIIKNSVEEYWDTIHKTFSDAEAIEQYNRLGKQLVE